MASPDPLYGDLNFVMLYTVIKAAADGRYAVLEEFGFELDIVNNLSEMKVKDFALLAHAPGFFIDPKTKKADNTALSNMLAYADTLSGARDAVDELIRRGATAAMIQAVEPSLDYEDHAWRRKLLGIERHAGRPPNVDDETLERIEAAWNRTVEFDGTLAQRFIQLCEQTAVGADTIWTALRQIVELRPTEKLDPVLADLPIRRPA